MKEELYLADCFVRISTRLCRLCGHACVLTRACVYVGTLVVGPLTCLSRPCSVARVAASAEYSKMLQGTSRASLTPGQDAVRVVVRPEKGLGLLVRFASPKVCVVVGWGGGGRGCGRGDGGTDFGSCCAC